MEQMNGQLQVGEVYETVIGNQNVGKSVYIGMATGRRVKYHHVLIFRNKKRFDQIACWRFNNPSFENGKLKVILGNEKVLSNLEKKFIDEALKRAGL